VTLASTCGATIASCPAWQIIYASQLLSHLGGQQGQAYALAGDSGLAPTTGNNVVARAYWATPWALAECADGELMSDFSSINAAFTDVRNYTVYVSMIDDEAADAGFFGIDNLEGSAISRPGDVTPAVSWGAGGTAFDDATNGFMVSSNPAILPAGTGTVSAANVVVGPGAGATGYEKAEARATAAILMADTSDKLVRIKWTLASSATNSCPSFRLMCFDLLTAPLMFGKVWGDGLGGGVAKALMSGPSQGDSPYAVPSTGVTVEQYIYTQAAGATDAGKLVPSLDLYNAGAYPGATSWAAENGTITISGVAMESLSVP